MNSIKRNLSYLVVITSIAVSMLLIAFVAQVEDNTTSVSSEKNSDPTTGSEKFPYEIGKSHSYKNLQLFFLTSESNVIDKAYITLAAAMARFRPDIIQCAHFYTNLYAASGLPWYLINCAISCQRHIQFMYGDFLFMVTRDSSSAPLVGV